MNLEEYFDILPHSKRFQHFIEECYCDHIGIKLLLEHYENPKTAVQAISGALNYLIMQECIKSDMSNGLYKMKDTHSVASLSMYFSVLRMEMLLVILQYSGLGEIEQAFWEIQERMQIIDYWQQFIEQMPSGERLALITENDLPDIDRNKMKDLLIREFYYSH